MNILQLTTTVMTVGFVNAGLLSLQQAIGVIFGANIGTTMTGQLVSFNLTDIALPAVVVGVAGTMAARRLRTRAFWRAVLGFGLLFFGMNMMSHELKSLAKLPEFVRVFSVFDCAPSARSARWWCRARRRRSASRSPSRRRG